MPGTTPIVADQLTISNMVKAFAECQSECNAIQGTVDGARASLTTNWQSDAAAPRYLQEVDNWSAGFQKVRQGLDMLNGNMQSYSQLTTTTEDDNALAAAWATPAA